MSTAEKPPHCPNCRDGSEGNWQVSPEKLLDLFKKGVVRFGKFTETWNVNNLSQIG
jgi:hypothetical protein